MGIDIWSLNFLLGATRRPFGKTLQLGRQALYLPLEHREFARQIIRERQQEYSLEELESSTGYAENVFKFLGAAPLLTIDNSNYEGADVLHDLNAVVPPQYVRAFDTIIDAGTLEHIFNFPVAIKNIQDMTALGGQVIIITVANNWLGHGLYQFSPELLYRVFSPSSGFQVDRMEFVEIGKYPEPWPAEDPASLGRRIEIQITRAPTFLCMCATRVEWPAEAVQIQQSDYITQWNHHLGEKQNEISPPP